LCELAARYDLAANIEPMPWVQVSTVARAKRILAGTARPNQGLLVDPIHFFRADNRLDELQGVRTNYVQLCDAPAERPGDMQEVIRQARSDRLFPGEGGLDLQGLLRALPADLPISVETPYAKPLVSLERARQALAATQKLLLPRVA
jgi:sugar phosphate isomerase/epimerase